MNISINEPCHENWDAMTPNTQGAFCKSCAKDVVDFSKMGISEIKSFFSKPQGKVCGRFEEKQLQELTFDDFFAKFTYWNFAKKFAVIFFMAFGFWIFSNSSAFAQNDRHMMTGEVAYVPEKTSTVKQQPVKPEQPTTCEKKMIMGKMKTTKQEVVKEPEQMMMGMIAIRPQIQKVVEPVKADTIKKEKQFIEDNLELINKPENTIKGNAIVTNVVTEIPYVDNIIKGDVICAIEKPVKQKEPIKQITVNPIPEVTKKDSVVADIQRIKEIPSQTIIYPNPSNGNFLIETTILTKQTVNVLDETGRLVLTQHIAGTTGIDASNLKAGIYTVIIKDNFSDAIVKKRIAIVK